MIFIVMPTIKKPKPKPSARRKQRQSLYQTKQWRELAKWYRMHHPICEQCAQQGRLRPAEHIHHILSPFDYGLSKQEMMDRLLDPDNLMAVCHDCHNILHGNMKKVDDGLKK